MQIENYDAITFDVYGTLIDWEPTILSSFKDCVGARHLYLKFKTWAVARLRKLAPSAERVQPWQVIDREETGNERTCRTPGHEAQRHPGTGDTLSRRAEHGMGTDGVFGHPNQSAL